jgi:MHS family proline/betaine transporter-like MFS transporter
MTKINLMTISSILIGTMLEWYDFSLLGLMAPFISTLFFPGKDPALSLLATFGVFASGFIARPIGGILFGHLGDRYGRRSTLSLTVILMALPTTLIGLLPTYDAIGVFAPVALVVLRIVQGFAASGEYPGAICFLAEISSPENKGFWGSVSIFGVTGGIFLGSLISFMVSHTVSNEQMLIWGWRIPFLVGMPLGLVGWMLRYKITESNEFLQAAMHAESVNIPLRNILKTNLSSLAKVILFFALSSTSFFLGFIYIPSYLISLHKMTFQQSLLSNSISMICLISFIPFFGFLSDKLSRKSIMLAGSICLALFYYPIFRTLLDNSFYSYLGAQISLAFCVAIFVGPMAAASAEMFPTLTRYTGVSVSLNLGVSLIGGTCPFVAAYLSWYSGSVCMPCVYPIVLASLCILTLLKVKSKP